MAVAEVPADGTSRSTTAPASLAELYLSDQENSRPFYFETDHIALKGNLDYQRVLQTVATLEAQRVRAIADLEKLIDRKQEALADPIGFVAKLQNKEDLDLPCPQKVPSVPHIAWETYTTNIEPFSGKHKHMTRNKVHVNGSENSDDRSSTPENEEFGTVVRGRIRDETKPDTFNQLWSVEEQKKLEELLIRYPPEEVEARRWQRIAKALGNRTPLQVASRVQKYFIKLAKAGLPIPGRMPNVSHYTKKIHQHQRHNRFLHQPSTFLASHEPPVYMSDDDDCSSYSGNGVPSCGSSGEQDRDREVPFRMPDDMDVSDEDDVPEEMRCMPEYQEILRLKRAKKHRAMQQGWKTQHIGYKCDRCEVEPIVGTRWHCKDCPHDVSVDLCDYCVDCAFETDTHTSTHHLDPKVTAPGSSHIDKDYTKFDSHNFNYLDPNYMPAS